MAIFKNKFSHEEAGVIGYAYAFMNRPDECFLWLEKEYKNKDKGSRGLVDFLVSPLLNPVRKDPRYAAFKKKLNFPE